MSILILDIHTDAPEELLKDKDAIFLEVNKGGMLWKVQINNAMVMSSDQEEQESNMAIPLLPKQKKAMSHFPMNMSIKL